MHLIVSARFRQAFSHGSVVQISICGYYKRLCTEIHSLKMMKNDFPRYFGIRDTVFEGGNELQLRRYTHKIHCCQTATVAISFIKIPLINELSEQYRQPSYYLKDESYFVLKFDLTKCALLGVQMTSRRPCFALHLGNMSQVGNPDYSSEN